METLLIYETIARVSNALAMTVGASQTLCFDNFRRNATEEQKMEILPGLAAASTSAAWESPNPTPAPMRWG